MKPLVTFPDPEAAIHAYYVEAFAARSEEYKPATIGTGYPGATLDNATHLQVQLEAGNADDYPVTERAQVRVTAHVPPDRGAGDTVGGRSDAKRLATLAQGLLYAHPGDDEVAGCRPQLGRSDVITDPDTRNLMVWFTFWVDLKATVLAS